jgi:uncharacterized protein YjbK
MNNREKELKIKITEHIYKKLISDLKIINGPFDQKNSFFDSEYFTLLKNRWALRLRKEEDSHILTAKGPAVKKSGYYDRPEIEEKLPENIDISAFYKGFNLESMQFKPCVELLKKYGNLFVTEMFSFSNTRTVLEYMGLHLEADRTIIKNSIFYELEIETDNIEKSSGIIKKLFTGYNWPLEYSKSGKMAKAVKIFGFLQHLK